MGQNTLPFWYLLHSGYAVHYQPLLSESCSCRIGKIGVRAPHFFKLPGIGGTEGFILDHDHIVPVTMKLSMGNVCRPGPEIITVCIAVVPVIKDPELVMHGVDSIIVSFQDRYSVGNEGIDQRRIRVLLV